MTTRYFNDRLSPYVLDLEDATFKAREYIHDRGLEFLDLRSMRQPTVDDSLTDCINVIEESICEADDLCWGDGGPELNKVDDETTAKFREALREYLERRIDLSQAAWQDDHTKDTLRVYADRHEFLNDAGEP